MRVILAGMNAIGTHALEVLAEHTEVVAVITVKERGKLFMDLADFTEITRRLNIPLYKISNINSPETQELISSLNPDVGMALGWKNIIKDHMLKIPRLGWIGGHPGFLLLEGESIDPEVFSAPGNEPLQYAIRGGYKKTGMSLQWLKRKIDVGEIFARGQIELDEHETSAGLIEKMGRTTANLLSENLPSLIRGNPPRMRQELVNKEPYTKPITADDCKIDLNASPVDTYRLIRSQIYPYPNAYVDFYGTRIYIESAHMENDIFSDVKIRVGGSPYEHDSRFSGPLRKP